MVLTDRQRSDLHCGIFEYLVSLDGDAFAKTAKALAEADPQCTQSVNSTLSSTSSNTLSSIPLLEKKWTAVPRLQKKVLELERSLSTSAKNFGHRSISATGSAIGTGIDRRMIPRPPCMHTLKGHSGVVTTVAIHPLFTVVMSGSEDGTIKVWDHESGEYIRTLKGHTNTVNCLAFTPTGTHLASASSDLSIKLWEFATYTCVRTLRGHDHTISAIRFIPSPASVLTLEQSVENGTASGENTSSSATGIDVSSASSSTLVSASRDQTVKFWDLESGFCDHTLSDHSDWVRCIAVRESDGDIIATSGNDQTIYVYNLNENRRKIAELRGHTHVIESISFVSAMTPVETAGVKTSTGNNKSSTEQKLETIKNYIASGGRDRSVRLWNIVTEECLFVFEYHENWVKSVILHPSGDYIISAGDDRSIRVMDIKNKRCLRTIKDAHPHFVTSMAMHHTLPILVSGSVDQTIKCWLLD